eukprot:gene4508-8962_t
MFIEDETSNTSNCSKDSISVSSLSNLHSKTNRIPLSGHNMQSSQVKGSNRAHRMMASMNKNPVEAPPQSQKSHIHRSSSWPGKKNIPETLDPDLPLMATDELVPLNNSGKENEIISSTLKSHNISQTASIVELPHTEKTFKPPLSRNLNNQFGAKSSNEKAKPAHWSAFLSKATTSSDPLSSTSSGSPLRTRLGNELMLSSTENEEQSITISNSRFNDSSQLQLQSISTTSLQSSQNNSESTRRTNANANANANTTASAIPTASVLSPVPSTVRDQSPILPQAISVQQQQQQLQQEPSSLPLQSQLPSQLPLPQQSLLVGQPASDSLHHIPTSETSQSQSFNPTNLRRVSIWAAVMETETEPPSSSLQDIKNINTYVNINTNANGIRDSMCFSFQRRVTSIATTPDGSYIVAGFFSGDVRLFDMTIGGNTDVEDRLGYLLGTVPNASGAVQLQVEVGGGNTPESCSHVFAGSRFGSTHMFVVDLASLRHLRKRRGFITMAGDGVQIFEKSDGHLRGFTGLATICVEEEIHTEDDEAMLCYKVKYRLVCGRGFGVFNIWEVELNAQRKRGNAKDMVYTDTWKLLFRGTSMGGPVLSFGAFVTVSPSDVILGNRSQYVITSDGVEIITVNDDNDSGVDAAAGSGSGHGLGLELGPYRSSGDRSNDSCEVLVHVYTSDMRVQPLDNPLL